MEFSSMRASILALLLGPVLWWYYSPVLSVSEIWRTSAVSKLTTIENRAEIKLPGGAKILYFEHQTTGDELIRAKLLLKLNDFQEMLSTNGLAESQFSTSNNGFLGSNDGDWDPVGAVSFPVFAREVRSGSYLYLGYLENHSQIIIYIYWFRT
jgi:hypothetical protein